MKTTGTTLIFLLAFSFSGCRLPGIPEVSPIRGLPGPRGASKVIATTNLQTKSVVKASYETDLQDSYLPNADSISPLEPSMFATSRSMTLAELQALAIQNNPTIQALVATTNKAAGYRTQVGLLPNPTVGYQAVQLADQGTDQHTVFIERQFIRGGKLALNRQVLNEGVKAQRLELDTQQIRVLTDVEVAFYRVLAAQRRLALITEFRPVVEKGTQLAEARFTAQEGTRVDILQAKIQENEIDLLLQQAEIALETAWAELSAITGTPNLTRVPVLGDLPEAADHLDWPSLASRIVTESPEMSAAHARIARSRANLTRQSVQAVPNVTAQIAAGVDNESNSGLINLQIGVPLTVNNRNQGNISAANAEYCRALSEAQRIELSIKSRLAVLAREYDSALAAVERFSKQILPNALEALQLAEESYRAGESSFVQILVARRTFFDSNISFLEAQTQLAQARAKIEGSTLTGGLDPVVDDSGDDGLRDQALDQQ